MRVMTLVPLLLAAGALLPLAAADHPEPIVDSTCIKFYNTSPPWPEVDLHCLPPPPRPIPPVEILP